MVGSAIGKFIGPSGITKPLVSCSVYGKGVAETNFVGGGDYVKCKEGMEIIAEAIMTLQFEEFMESELFMKLGCSCDQEELTDILINRKETLCENSTSSTREFKRFWNESKISGMKLKEAFCKFVS